MGSIAVYAVVCACPVCKAPCELQTNRSWVAYSRCEDNTLIFLTPRSCDDTAASCCLCLAKGYVACTPLQAQALPYKCNCCAGCCRGAGFVRRQYRCGYQAAECASPDNAGQQRCR